jgi:hypothetical protein
MIVFILRKYTTIFIKKSEKKKRLNRSKNLRSEKEKKEILLIYAKITNKWRKNLDVMKLK